MNAKALIGVTAGLGALVAASFAPIVPADTHTFAALNDGRYELRQTARQTPFSLLVQQFGTSSSSDGGSSDDSNQRVVRIYNFNDNFVHFGTGYIIADGLVLTNNHVINEMNSPVVKDGKDFYSGIVVAKDPEKDLALVRIPSGKEFEPIKIGTNPKSGEYVTVRTLDINDALYQRGPDSSRKDLRQFKYDGQISPESKKSIQELEQAISGVQLQRDELYRMRDGLYKPHSQIHGKDSSPRGRAQDFGKYKDRDTENELHYRSETDKDAFIPGMSGSSAFNISGNLIGVSRSQTSSNYGSLGSSWVGSLPENMPESVKERIREIDDKERAIDELIRRMESEIYLLKNPLTFGIVPANAILEFLKEYANSTASQKAD